MLSPAQVEAREGKLTASRVACLMTGDQEKIMNLWRELVGDPAFVPENLDDIWAVQLGSWTEPFNLDWYEKRTGRPLSRRGEEAVVHPHYEWAAATLDGWDDQIGAPVECKHVGGFEPTAKILERYAPQAHWQMLVTGATQCIFSIIEGAREPIIEIVELDRAYATELLERAHAFMLCVKTMTPPVALPAVAAPVKAEKVYDMQGNNHFASQAQAWRDNRAAAKEFASIERDLKAGVPADAVRCFGYGIQIKRNKIGSLSIKEME